MHNKGLVDCLTRHVRENDTVTIKKEGDTRVYFAVVSNHFRENKEAMVRIEALGSAVTTAVRVVHILESCGIGQVCKVKCKEKTINYELENGRL